MIQNIEASSWTELFHKVKLYFDEFPPQGYGTRIEKQWQEENKYLAKITRGFNCD